MQNPNNNSNTQWPQSSPATPMNMGSATTSVLPPNSPQNSVQTHHNPNTTNLNQSSTTYKKDPTMQSLSSLSLYQKFWMGLAILGAAIITITTLPRMILRPSTIEVVGEGKIDFQADKVTMVVTKVNTATTSEKAISDGEASIQALVDSVKILAGDSAKITQAFYQVQPVALGSEVQYQAVNAFSVEFSDVNKTNDMVKTLYRDGATSVSNVTFGTNNQEEVSQEARDLAVKDARKRAEKIAKSAGKRLGKLVLITDDNLDASSTLSSTENEANSFSNVSTTKLVSIVYEIW